MATAALWYHVVNEHIHSAIEVTSTHLIRGSSNLRLFENYVKITVEQRACII